jgi:hypothetical protein
VNYDCPYPRTCLETRPPPTRPKRYTPIVPADEFVDGVQHATPTAYKPRRAAGDRPVRPSRVWRGIRQASLQDGLTAHRTGYTNRGDHGIKTGNASGSEGVAPHLERAVRAEGRSRQTTTTGTTSDTAPA